MKKLFNKTGIFAIAFLIANLLFVNGALGQATVATNKSDYRPGDTVFISGASWMPGETVSISILEIPSSSSPTVYSVQADNSGAISNDQFITQQSHLGKAFFVTAVGNSSNDTAQCHFTDAPFTSAASGNWNLGATWGNAGNNVEGSGYPGPGDQATVQQGHVVTLTANAACSTLNVSGHTSGGASNSRVDLNVNTLTVSAWVNITSSNNSRTADLVTNGGTISLDALTLTTGAGGNPGVTAFNLTTNSTLNVSGAITSIGSGTNTFTFNNAGATVNYNGTGAQTIFVTPYRNLTISGVRTTNSVTLSTISVNGNYAATATFTSGGYVTTGTTVTFSNTGGVTQTIAGTPSFNNLTLNNSTSTTNFGSSTTSIAGNLTVTAGTMNGGTSTIIFNGATSNLAGGNNKNFYNIQVNSGSTTVLTTANATIGSNFINNGIFSFTGAPHAVTFNGTTQSISGTGTTTFNDAAINAGSIVTLSKNIITNGGTFNVLGRMNCGTNLVTGTSLFLLSSGGTLGIGDPFGITALGCGTGATCGNIRTSGGRSYNANSNLVFTGSANQSSVSQNFNSITIANTGGVGNNTVSIPTPTVNSLVLTSGLFSVTTLTVNSSGTISKTSGDFVTGAGVVTFSGSGTVTGTVSFNIVNIAGAVNFGAGPSSVSNTLAINTGGSVATNAPTYGSSSTLQYQTGNAISLGLEWPAGTSGITIPNNVNVTVGGTILNMGSAGARNCRGFLQIGNGTLNMQTMTGALTVASHFTDNANFIMSTVAGGDLSVGGNMSFGGSTFTANGRKVTLTGSGTISTLFTGSNKFFDLTINASGTYNSNSFDVGNDLTISAGTLSGPGAGTINVAGNWNNNGTFTANSSTVVLNGTGTQTIGGSSVTTFGNTTPAGGLTINKTSGFASLSQNIKVAGTLIMTSGNIDCGSSTLELGTSTSNVGTLNYSANKGNIIGNFKRWFNSTGAKQFPLGVASSSGTATATHNVLLTFTNLGTNGSITGRFIASDPGSAGLPLTESSLTFGEQFTEGYWSLVKGDGLASNNYALELKGTGFVSRTFDANTRTIKRANSGSNWTFDGTNATAAPPLAYRNGLNDFSEFALAASCPDPTINTQPSSPAAVCAGTGTPSFTVSATGPGSLTYQWQESTAGTGGPFSNISNGGVYSGTDAATLTITNPPFSMNGYAYQVIVTRACGSTATTDGLAVLTVNQSPSITASNIAPVNNDINICGASVMFGSNVIVTSGTPAPTLTYSLTNFGALITSPYTFPVGVTTVYVKASNTCGEDIKSFTVTVVDNQNPTASNPSTINVECFSDIPSPNIAVVTDEADNCSPLPVVAFVSDNITSAVCDGATVTVLRTYSVTDASNNFITVTQTINVADVTDPTASNPSTVNVECFSEIPVPDVAVVTDEDDNCTGTPVVAWVSDNVTSATCDGATVTVTRTYSVTDCAGNSINVYQTINVADVTNPTISSPGANMTINCPAVPVFTPPTATDNCNGTPSIVQVSDITTPGSCSGTYSRTKTWKAVDCSGNESGTVSQTITVQDITVPTITTCPLSQSFCKRTDDNYTIPVIVASDLCSAVTITYSITGATTGSGSGNDASGLFNVGVSTIEWTVTDACNNTSTCSTTVNVVLQPASGTLTKTPNVSKVCEGTNVSAIATLGTGGTGTITDILEYRCNNIVGGWTSWMPYTSGNILSTTGKLEVQIRTYRTATGTHCTSSVPTIVSWMVNVGPDATNNNASQSVVYGGAITTVVITATDADSPGSSLVIDAVSYTKNGGSSISGFPLGLDIFLNTTLANSRTWNVTGCMKGTGVGTYVITVTVKDECGRTKSTSFTVIVTPGMLLPIADAYYTGACFFWTTGPSSSTATLTLAATVKNQVFNCGDITTARVSFYVRNGTGLTPINGAQNLPVGLVDPSNPSIGAASAIVQYNIGSNSMLPLDIVIRVTGNYINLVSPTYDKQITIAVPKPGGQIVGGGTLDNLTSSGYLGGANTLPITDFSFEVKYNKSLTNPQGRVELFIRTMKDKNGNPDVVEHTYKVKSTSISVLALGQPNPAYGQFGSKANLSEVLSDGSSIGLESGITLTLNLFDGLVAPGGPKPDSLGITLYRKNGGIWYSNNWVVNKTVMKAILAGEVSVNGTSAAPRINLEDLPVTYHKGSDEKAAEETADDLLVRVYGNPSNSAFSILIQGNNFDEPISMRVFDANGILVETKQSVNSYKMFSIGETYKVGVYFAEFIQGKQRKVVKLIKQ